LSALEAMIGEEILDAQAADIGWSEAE